MRNFLLVGRTGVGKSSFVNATFGEYITETSEFEACTKLVEHHAYNTPLGDVCLIDTPGLAEDDEACDEAYLSLVRTKVDLNQIYATIYVSRLNETRFRPDEKRTLRLLTNRLGVSIWNHSILALTFAASVPGEQCEAAASRRIGQIEDFIDSLKREKDFYSRFLGFKDFWLVDNLVNNWTSEAVPILSVLTK
jgi:tRNA U34 5-carboxymethylaminomethyl modifying GTPase MnmE/TrmE